MNLHRRMIANGLIAMLLFGNSSSALFGQGHPPVPNERILTEYQLYFIHLGRMEISAQELEKRHIDATVWRAHERVHSGLDDASFAYLDTLSRNYLLQEAPLEKSLSAAIAKLDAILKAGSDPKDARLEVYEIYLQETDLLRDAVTSLQALLGTSNFTKLTSYIEASSKVQIVSTGAASSIPPPASAEEVKK